MFILQLITNGLVAGSIYALLGLSFNLIYGPTRVFHFSHGGVFVLAGYSAVQLVLWGLPWYVAVVLAVGLGILLGIGIEYLLYRPLRNLGATTLTFLLASIGLFICIENFALLVWRSSPMKLILPDVFGTVISIGGVRVTVLQVIIVVLTLSLGIILTRFIGSTKLGRAIRALETNPTLTEIVGINSEQVRLFVYGAGSALVAVAAVFMASDTALRPDIGTMAIIMAVVVTISGGAGNYGGTTAAGYLIGMAENLGLWVIPSEWKVAIPFFILMLLVLLKPSGLFNFQLQREG